MNFKKTALATAVGATLAISGVAQADGHTVQLYGRINNAINITDFDGVDPADDDDSTNVSTIGSRVGIKASAPINDDLTAFGRFEWSASSDDETDSFGDTRIGEVGVRGDNFGTLKVGNMWSTFYNIVGTHMDPTVTLGSVLYSAVVDLPYRVSNAIQYSNDFGPVTLSAELRLSDEDNPDEAPGAGTEKIGGSDGTGIGVSFNITDNLLIAGAIDQSDAIAGGSDEDRIGFAVKWTADNFWVSGSFAENDVDKGDTLDQTQAYAGMSFGGGLNGFVGYGIATSDASGSPDDATALTWNVTKRLGTSGFRVYYEGVSTSDSDDLLGGEGERHLFGARIDF